MADVSEQQLAKVLVAHLQTLGADVYEEVEVSGGVADIVARVGAELWIIEVKASLSWALLAQGRERRRLAHRVYVAAPYSRNLRDFAGLCEEMGVGLFLIRPGAQWDPPTVREEVASRRWNTRPVDLAAKLRPEHKTHAKAGAASAAGRWTPFRSTCEALLDVVSRQPGIKLKAAIEGIRHHYRSVSSARSSLATWIREGKVPGVQMRDGALWPVSQEGGRG